MPLSLKADDIVVTTLRRSTVTALQLLHVAYPENPDARAETERQLRIQTASPLNHHHLDVADATIRFKREMGRLMQRHPLCPVYRFVTIDYETGEVTLAPAPEWIAMNNAEKVAAFKPVPIRPSCRHDESRPR